METSRQPESRYYAPGIPAETKTQYTATISDRGSHVGLIQPALSAGSGVHVKTFRFRLSELADANPMVSNIKGSPQLLLFTNEYTKRAHPWF